MNDDRVRIDKWLWFARLAKTRTIAQKLAVSGRVRINRRKTENAARPVKIGDVLTITLDSGVRVLRVSAIGSRRGPASEAQLLYEDLSPKTDMSPRTPSRPAIDRPAGSGRPTKRERRTLNNFRNRAAGLGEDFPSGSR